MTDERGEGEGGRRLTGDAARRFDGGGGGSGRSGGGGGGGDAVNILVVDDNAENRLTLETILSEPGQEVITAASGRDALRCLLGMEFAVILLDVNMPIMDGFETAAMVRQRKSSERTPIIFITAFSDEPHVSRGYSLGAVDYIVSPVVPEVLRSKVAVFVDLFRKTEQVRRQAESLRRRADQLYQLTEASLAINSVNSLDEILEIVTETARDLVAARRALTVTNLEQGHSGMRRPVAFSDDGGETYDRDDFVAQATALTAALPDRSRAVVLPARGLLEGARAEGAGEMRAPGAGGGAWRGSGAATAGGWLAAPLTSRDGRSFGWLHLSGPRGGEFDDEDRTILTQLAQIASIAIENTLSSEAREANRLKDEFLTTLSHELRTPLTAMLGWTRVLRTGAYERERFEHGLEVIERNVNAQAKLIEDLLDVSRIIAGKLRVSLRPMRLLAAVETAIEGMRPAAEAKGVELHLRIDPDVAGSAAIAGDSDRLQQVGWNLVSNAIKFTAPGGRIDVTVSRQGDTFQVAVRDTGKGISAQFLEHVFDRFRQDDSSSTRAHGGLGIGLAIVRHIVELHGGSVTAASPGTNLGATFIVSLPALPEGVAVSGEGEEREEREDEEAEEGAGAGRSAGAGSDGGDRDRGDRGGGGDRGASEEAGGSERIGGVGEGVAGGGGGGSGGRRRDAGGADWAADVALEGLRVLVVDDEPDTREILSEILRGAGATVATAASLGETLSLFDPFRPDVLVSDIAMPGGDGYSLIRQVRRRGRERGGGVAAIAVSAHAREEDRRRALAAGFDRYVTKPVEPAFLLAVVQEVAPPVQRPAGAGKSAGAGCHGEGGGGGEVAGGGNGNGLGGAGAGGSGGGGGAAVGGEIAGRRILLVEDDADTREALKTLLELNGHVVAVASNGGDAVAHAIEHRPEVALVDIGLPEIDGNEVARRIRAKLGSGGIFLVALTGYGGESDVERARAAGFDAHFTKPVELARLDRLLRSDASGVAGAAGAEPPGGVPAGGGG